MQEFVSNWRDAIVGSGSPTGLRAVVTPDLEPAPKSWQWQEGTEEDPAWYTTD